MDRLVGAWKSLPFNLLLLNKELVSFHAAEPITAIHEVQSALGAEYTPHSVLTAPSTKLFSQADSEKPLGCIKSCCHFFHTLVAVAYA
jgi:hypothetical protein